MNPSSSIFSIFKNISLNKIMKGANKTITFVNKAIPAYKQVRPMFGNAKNIISILKEKNTKSLDKISDRPIQIMNFKKEESGKNILNDTLTFFQ